MGGAHRGQRDHLADALRAQPRARPGDPQQVGIGEDIVWLGQEGYAMAVMILADVWKTAPFMALLLLAGLQVIPDDVYDAAKVDGATTWQRFRRITIPC